MEKLPVPNDPKPLPWFKFILFALTLIGMAIYAAQSPGQMCGDCNQDGKVTIAELITAVNNAMQPLCDCSSCPTDQCVEFPSAQLPDGSTITCNASVCSNEVTVCALQLYHNSTTFCQVTIP
jgi:hypothetical protein